MNKEKHYTNGEITVVWKPNLCKGARYCWREFPEVFHHNERPWITMDGADSNRIIEQVKRCPSGALSIEYNEKNEK